MGMLLSIVIPVYNRLELLYETLNSVRLQVEDRTDVEVVVVDDGSDVDVCRKLKEWRGGEWKWLRCERNDENLGKSAARNKGILNSKGEFIGFLDADDLLYVDAVNVILAAIKSVPDLDLVFGRTVFEAGGKRKLSKSLKRFFMKFGLPRGVGIYEMDGEIFFKRFVLVYGTYVHTGSLVVRGSIFERSGLFDLSMNLSQDLELWFRLFSVARKVVYVDYPFSIIRRDYSSYARDLTRLARYELRRYRLHLRWLRTRGFEKEWRRLVQKRMYARRLFYQGVDRYRAGDFASASKKFLRSFWLDQRRFVFEAFGKSLVKMLGEKVVC